MTPNLTANNDPTELGQVIGHRADGTPIALYFGGAGGTMTVEPDEGPDEEGDADPDDDGQDSKGGDADYTPPDREQWERMQAAVRRNNAENRNLRQLRKMLTTKGMDLSTDEGRAAFDQLVNGGGAAKAPADKAATDRAVERAVAKTESRYREVLADMALKAALVDAGWSGKNIDRVKRQINFDELEIVDGKIVGIAEQVDEIKVDIPEWFQAGKKPAEQRRGAREVDGGDKPTKSTGKSTGWLQQVDDQMTGKTR